MLYPAIECIQRFFNDAGGPTATVGNVAEIVNGNDAQVDADIIISLVNIEEVRMARDQQYVVRANDQLLPKHPAIHFDIYLLFTAFGTGYANNIRNLQEVIGFFQRHPAFSATAFPTLAADGIERLTTELVSLSLEQLQQLWAMLGGKYQPSALYKLRMLTIDSVQDQPVGEIRQIDMHFKRKP